MNVVNTSVDEFLSITSAFHAADPIRTNLIGSIAVSYSKKVSDRLAYWWVVFDDSGTVVGTAIKTGTRPLLLSPMSHEAIILLSSHIFEQGIQIPGTNGPTEEGAAFLEKYCSLKGDCQMWKLRVSLCTFELAELVRFEKRVDGYASQVTLADFDVALGLMTAFNEDANVDPYDPTELVRSKIEIGLLWFWKNSNNEIVCYGGCSDVVRSLSGSGLARIGPVFTPVAHRRRGYGAALTVFLAELLLKKNARVMLFTDAAYEPSNILYSKLGFQLIDKTAEYEVVDINST